MGRPLLVVLATAFVFVLTSCGGNSSSPKSDLVFCSGLAPNAKKIDAAFKRAHPNLYVTRATCKALTGASG